MGEPDFYSPWFPPGVYPARPGDYLTSRGPDRNHIVLLHWSGSNWFDTSGELSEFTMIGGERPPGYQPYFWHGLSAAHHGIKERSDAE